MRTGIVVGGTGRGKTTFLKNEIYANTTAPKFTYDPNGEYLEYNTFKGVCDIKNFKNYLEQCENKTNTLIHIEEASIYIDNMTRMQDIRNLLVRKRHTNNIILLTFHSLRQVPLEIMDLIDYCVLFGTNDNITNVTAKYKNNPEFLDFFNDVQAETKLNHHHYEVFKFQQY